MPPLHDTCTKEPLRLSCVGAWFCSPPPTLPHPLNRSDHLSQSVAMRDEWERESKGWRGTHACACMCKHIYLCTSIFTHFQGRQPTQQNTHPDINNLQKRLPQSLSATLFICKGRRGIICTSNSKSVFAQTVLLFGWVLFWGVGVPSRDFAFRGHRRLWRQTSEAALTSRPDIKLHDAALTPTPCTTIILCYLLYCWMDLWAHNLRTFSAFIVR